MVLSIGVDSTGTVIQRYRSLSMKRWSMYGQRYGFVPFEPHYEKTNNLHMRKQRLVTAKLISAFVFATRIVTFLSFLNPKFQASINLLCLYSSVCVEPVRKPHC